MPARARSSRKPRTTATTNPSLGLFTEALIDRLDRGADVRRALVEARAWVIQATRAQQIPWIVTGSVAFDAGAPARVGFADALPPLPGPPPEIERMQDELQNARPGGQQGPERREALAHAMAFEAAPEGTYLQRGARWWALAEAIGPKLELFRLARTRARQWWRFEQQVCARQAARAKARRRLGRYQRALEALDPRGASSSERRAWAGELAQARLPWRSHLDAAEDPRADCRGYPDWQLSLPTGLEFMRARVTEGQYLACVDAGPCPKRRRTRPPIDLSRHMADPERPVEVTFDDSRQFCAWVGGRVPRTREWLAEATSPGVGRAPGEGRRTGCPHDLWVSDGLGRSVDVARPCELRGGESFSSLRGMHGRREWTIPDTRIRATAGGRWYDSGGVGIRCVRAPRRRGPDAEALYLAPSPWPPEEPVRGRDRKRDIRVRGNLLE